MVDDIITRTAREIAAIVNASDCVAASLSARVTVDPDKLIVMLQPIYAAAREQAAAIADQFDRKDTYECGAIASSIRAMNAEKTPPTSEG